MNLDTVIARKKELLVFVFGIEIWVVPYFQS